LDFAGRIPFLRDQQAKKSNFLNRFEIQLALYADDELEPLFHRMYPNETERKAALKSIENAALNCQTKSS
jgi:hypothetical protein